MSALREILAHFSIEVDSKKLEEGNVSIGEGIEKLKKYGEAALGAFAIREVYEFIHGLTEQAEALEQQAQAFGMSIEEMNQWNGAAKIAGVQGDALNAALRVMAKNVGNATSPAVAALQKLGVAVRDSSGQVRPLTDLFEDAASAIGGMDNAGARATAGTAVFGRGFQRILPLISQGREGMAALRKEVEELGGGMDEAFVEKSKEVNAETQRLNILFTSLKVTIAAGLLPVVVWLTQKMIEVGKPILEVLKHTSALHAAAAALGAYLAIMLAESIVPLALGFGALAADAAAVLIPFLLIEDFITFLRGGDSLTGRFIDKVFGKGAAKQVQEFIKQLTSSWTNFGSRMTAVWDFIKLGFEIAWTEIKFFGLGIAAALLDAWTQASSKMVKLQADALDLLPDTGDQVKKLRAQAASYDAYENGGGAQGELDKLHDQARLDLAHESDDIKDRIFGIRHPVAFHRDTAADQHTAAHPRQATGFHRDKPAPPNIHNEVHVHVPPGTPNTLLQRIGTAAANGAQKGTETARAKHAALNPGKG